MIPLRTRESFFRDPFFSDCWDVMDRRRRDWEREVNHHSRRFLSDFDDLDRGFGRNSFGKLWGRDRGYDLLEKNDLLNSSVSDKDANGFGLQSDKDNFKVLLDVQQFSPEELTVKTCDNSILIEGKHEEKKDPHGFVSRHFTRKYTVPSDVKVDEVQCNLSSDGVLHVTAPRLNPAITNKTSSTATTSSTEKRRSAERETTSAKEYPEQRRATPEKETRRSSEREELSSSSSSRYSSAAEKGKSDLSESAFGRLRDSDRLSSRLFDSYYAGFPDFDLVPFWRRRDWSGGQGEIIERLSNHKTNIGVLSDRDNFKVQLDVQQFTPEELSVKTVDNVLVIEGKHEDKKDSLGYVSRHFTRKYDIPSDVKAEDVKCSFSSDGLLIVTAPRQRPALAHEKVSVIPISVQHQSSSSRSVEHKKESRISETNGKEKEHVIRMEKQDSSTAPITNQNGVHIEEQISRSSSNQDAHKEMNRQTVTEGIVKHPGEREHIIPITSA